MQHTPYHLCRLVRVNLVLDYQVARQQIAGEPALAHRAIGDWVGLVSN
jgi:hypothetical protein